MTHPLLGHYLAAAGGRFPPADNGVTMLPPLPGGLSCSVAFTGHAMVASDRPEPEVRARNGAGVGGWLGPDFLRYLAGAGGTVGSIDVTLVARGRGGGTLPRRHDAYEHPRVQRATGLRRDIRVYGDERGLVTLAEGLAGRRELGIEATPGLGRSLLRDALALVPEGEPVFAAVAPGNARSLRAFLAVGFTPIGSEAIVIPAP